MNNEQSELVVVVARSQQLLRAVEISGKVRKNISTRNASNFEKPRAHTNEAIRYERISVSNRINVPLR